MRKDLETLLKLQGMDYELGELERSKDYLPDMISNLEKEIEEISNELKRIEQELTEKTLLKKKLEIEVDALNDELEKYQKQMREIKTNREYDALTTEIANRKLKISNNEEKILELMSALDELEEREVENKRKFEEIHKNNSAQLETLRKEISSIGTKVKIKEDERKNVTVRMDKRLLATYDRIRKGKGAEVVVMVRKGACGACYKALPPQRIQEIKMENAIITCDSCGRILIWSEE